MVKIGDAKGWEKLGGGSSSQARCQKCGKPVKDPKFKFCFDCNKKMRENGEEFKKEINLPKECIFDTFYDDKNHPKREIFIEGAEKAAEVFKEAEISTTSIRQLFYPLKEEEKKLKANKTMDFGFAKDTFHKFHRQVVYNISRKGEKRSVLHPIFKEFVDKHLDLATSSREQFLGFVEYLTSIVARLK